MNFNKFTALLVLTIITIQMRFVPSAFSENTQLSLTPQSSYPIVGESFIVNVTVTDVIDLSAWQIKLAFNPSIINCVEIIVPADNLFAGHDTTGISPKIDNYLGFLTVFNGIWELEGVNGSGMLCQIKFNASCPGISILSFIDEMEIEGTYLQNSEFNNIPFEASEGIVQVVGENFRLYKFNVTQNGTGYDITIYTNSNVTNFNFSEFSKKITFMVANTSNSTSFCTICIPKALLNGTFTVISNDTALSYTESSNDTYQCLQFKLTCSNLSIQVLTTILGDLNGDRKIDMKDISMAARAFGTVPGDQRWEPRADLNNDVKVDMKDITLIAKNFGKIWLN